MGTYLLTWNPTKWPWSYLQDSIAKVKDQGYCFEDWTCGVTKRIKQGDRVFLIKLGENPRGIMASGWAIKKVEEREHWNEERREKGKTALYVDVHFDTILDPKINIFPIEKLNYPNYPKHKWEPQASGVTIPDEIAFQLEKDWAEFLKQPIPQKELILAEEQNINRAIPEGATKQITVNFYERSAEARTISLRYHGFNCSICDFNFEKFYGEIGASYIHIHHLIPLSEIKNEYLLNPINDLRPVCPNCHAMIHQKKPAYTIDEVKELMEKTLKKRTMN